VAPVTTADAAPALAFGTIPVVGGRVTLSPDDRRIERAAFGEIGRIAVGGEVSSAYALPDGDAAAISVVAGRVVVFDLRGGTIGSAQVPTTVDGLHLRDLAVGPRHTVDALYGGDTLTVVAFTLEPSAREVRRWTFDAAAAERCDIECTLSMSADGFSVYSLIEGDQTVPFVDATGAEVTWPALPVPASFSTRWDEGQPVPRAVEITGPYRTGGAVAGPAWSIRLTDVVFDEELGQEFFTQPDGSLLAFVQFEPASTMTDAHRRAWLWLHSDGSTSAFDGDAISGLRSIAVRADDGALVGFTLDADGVTLGLLHPADT
jgi:hypothetical protein